MGRGWKVALFISLALNLFVVGAVAGGLILRARLMDEPAQARPRTPLFAAAQALPPDQRRAFRQMLRSQGRQTAPTLRQARATRRQAWESLAGASPDAATAKAALGQARALEGQARMSVEDRLVDYAISLPPGSRARLVEGLAHGAPNARPRR